MNRLFVYGTLCPNRENAHILGGIGGDWQKASVHGTIHILDWGPDKGLPAIILNDKDSLLKAIYLELKNWQKIGKCWMILRVCNIQECK